MSEADVLKDYAKFDFSDGRWTRSVYRRGQGPAVIVIHEMPGLHPLVVRFADHVVAAGMTAFLPSLFGTPGKVATPAYAVREIVKAICIRREFDVWASDRSSPIVDWLRALARQAHGECGGKGVGAIGMCFTGNFALAMMTEPAVVAPVLSQPSMPFALGARRRAAMGLSPQEVACAKTRFAEENLSAIGLRFPSDRLVPDERFATFKATFGDKFETIELQDEDAAKGTGMAPHSVLTIHLNTQDPTGPSQQAEQRVIAFFRERTGAGS
ncbi:MAG: dienelactone hydrolase family protein [Rhizomicrobium sp.]